MMSSHTSMSEPIKTSIAPWLSVSRATEAVSYYQAAFGAVERYRLEDDEGSVVVAQLAIGEAELLASGGQRLQPGVPGPSLGPPDLDGRRPRRGVRAGHRRRSNESLRGLRRTRLAHGTHRRPVWTPLGDRQAASLIPRAPRVS
jgi:hypothetical protein